MIEIIKISSSFLFSPLFYILVLFIIGLFNIINKKNKSGACLIFMSLTLYLFSCEFFISPVLQKLESRYSDLSEKNLKNSEIYILLGGGILNNTLVGNIPTLSAYSRIHKTVELYHKELKPIYISGGNLLENSETESFVYKKELIKLGVSEKDIFLETKSRNTYENSKYMKSIMNFKGIKSAILITSASHMSRSMYIFKDKKLEFYPAKTGYLGSYSDRKYLRYIPQFRNLNNSMIILHEYIGMVYYIIRY